MFDMEQPSRKYRDMDEHTMIVEIDRCRRIAGRLLGLRMKLFERVNTIHGTPHKTLDTDIDSPFMAGLEDAAQLPDMKVMGALINPLYQNEIRMVTAGLLTTKQYSAGKEELLDRMSRFHAMGSDSVAHAVLGASSGSGGNKWDTQRMDFLDGVAAPRKKAEEEYEVYVSYMHGMFQPTMKSQHELGFIDEEGNPQEPIYAFGEVIAAGNNLPSKRNHAEYIDKAGHYDIAKYLLDHRDQFPAVYHVGVGQLCPHISTEVDCESLFSQAGFLADARRSNTNFRFYERLVITKHRLRRIYCPKQLVKDMFMKRFKDDDWDEQGDRDAADFLEVEKSIFLEDFPMYADLFRYEDDGEDEEDNENENDKKLNGDDDDDDDDDDVE